MQFAMRRNFRRYPCEGTWGNPAMEAGSGMSRSCPDSVPPYSRPYVSLPGSHSYPYFSLPGSRSHQYISLPGSRSYPYFSLPDSRSRPCVSLPGSRSYPCASLPGSRSYPCVSLPGNRIRPYNCPLCNNFPLLQFFCRNSRIFRYNCLNTLYRSRKNCSIRSNPESIAK